MQITNIKSHWLLTSLLLVLVIGTGCTASGEPTAVEPIAGPEEITLYVAPETADCVGVAPQTCLRIKTDPNREWELLYDPISGFTYEAGYTYEIRVSKAVEPNPPADASSIRYELIEIVSKTAAAEDAGNEDVANDDTTGGVDAADETADNNMVNNDIAGILDGTQWTLTTMGLEANPITPLPDNPITAEFKDGQVQGKAGCNQFFASYTLLSAGQISFGVAGSTMMACPEDIMNRESQFLAALQTATSYELAEGMLTIQYLDGTLRFTTKTAPANLPLEGTQWLLTTFVSGEAASSLLNGTGIAATFVQGQVSGTAGCNSYFGSYEINAESIAFSPLSSTRKACAPEIMDQESAFLTALQTATSFTIQGDRLTVLHDAGSLIFKGTPQPATESADQVTWEEALALLNSGEVTSVSQTHSLQVTLTLKDGRSVQTTEPTIDDIFTAVSECGDPCAGITLATE